MNTQWSHGLRSGLARNGEDGDRVRARRHDRPSRMSYLDDARMNREMGRL